MNDVSAPAPIESDATFFDGLDNRRRRARLRLSSELQISENGIVAANWPLESIRRADGQPTELRISSTSAPELARISIADPAMRRALIQSCPQLYTQEAGKHTNYRIVGWSLTAAASIILVALYGIPLVADRLAPLVPQSWEKRVGDMVDGQIRTIFDARQCTGEEGQKAFAKMMKSIAGAVKPGVEVDAKVIQSGVRNAVALPGGKVYLFRGLLEKAESPDEIAGVLAHELGHVKHHDGMRRVIQAGGTSFLIGLLFGDVTGSGAIIFVTHQLIDASYSREAESNADGSAIEAMNELGRSPVPMGELMERITGDQRDDSMSILASHPLTGDRLDRFKREWRPATSTRPILDFGEWRAMKEMCADAPKEDQDHKDKDEK